ncbi:NUDIX hydrolase [Stenotrophomonas maltophilia]|nr:NUDIX hydrolase [Stenotrophomonas maltophilia]
MPQVYAALWNGTHYLITRKRIINNWWASNSVMVLTAEALEATLATAESPELPPAKDWQPALILLRSAQLAAASAGYADTPDGQGLQVNFSNAVQAMQATPPNPDQVGSAVTHLTRRLFRQSTLPERIRNLANTLPVFSPDSWGPALLTAQNLARDTRAWATQVPMVVVNQAGQWTLPGGRRHDNETEEDAARREFMEETGVLLDSGNFPRDLMASNRSYALVRFRTAIQDLQAIADAVCTNVRARPGAARPAASWVTDWEIDHAQIVAVAELGNYLGARAAITPPNTQDFATMLQQMSRPYSQSIDWYASMARALSSS